MTNQVLKARESEEITEPLNRYQNRVGNGKLLIASFKTQVHWIRTVPLGPSVFDRVPRLSIPFGAILDWLDRHIWSR
jgi:hypothetical protein